MVKKSDPSSSEPGYTKITFGDRFSAFTLKILRRPSNWLSSKMPRLKEDILKSYIATTPEALISLVLFLTIICIIPTVLGLLAVFMYRFLFGILLLPLAPMVLGIGLVVPKMSQSSRASAIDNELPFVLGYITTLAGGGISPLVTLERLSKVDLYPAIKKEAKRILMDIEVFGMDPVSALDKAARYNPNKALSDFLGGYTSVLRTGGDVVSYMESKLKDIFTYRAIKMKSASELIGTFAEAYISVSVILGISFFVLFAVQSLLGQGGGMGLNGVIIFSALFIPLVSAMFIYITDVIHPKEPFTYLKPYYVWLPSLTAIPLVYFILMLLLPQTQFYWRLGLGLLICVIPGAILNSRYASHRKKVENLLPSFLRDIAEIRKTGLAPEKCIEQLANRNYGGLTAYVRTMSAQLSWGVPLHRVMLNFSRSVKSWLTRAMAFLLLEVVDVGGGTVKMFGTLADFSQRMSEIEKEKKSALRPYIFIPYVGAVMVVVTTIMMIYFVTMPMGGSSSAGGFMTGGIDIKRTVDTLITSAILEAWIMGLVAGKMGEGSVAAGFKHAGALVAISLISVYIVSAFYAMPV